MKYNHIISENYNFFAGMGAGFYWIQMIFNSVIEVADNGNILKEHEVFYKSYFGINCWHINDHESAAMWSIYSNKGAVIAIQSTYKKFVDSFSDSPYIIHVSLIEYVDYLKDVTKWGNSFIPILQKGKSYEYEQEIRAVIWSREGKNKELCDPIESGIRIKDNLNTLIEKIYIAPLTPKWIHNLIINILNKYNVSKPIEDSLLEGKPVY